MGYEVVYEYHDRTDEGYNKEELKDFKKIVLIILNKIKLFLHLQPLKQKGNY